MTNKTEDRFYFGKSGQPERFAGYGAWHPTAPFVPKPQGAHRYKKGDRVVSHEGRNPRTGVIDRPVRDMYGNPEYVVYWDNDGGTAQVADQYLTKMSRPGQSERFGLEDACWEGYEPVGTKQKDGRTVPNCVPKDKNEQPEEFAEGGSAKISGNEVQIGGVQYKIAKSRKLEQLTEGEQKRIKAVGKSHWVANYDLRGPKGGQSMLDVYSNGVYILTNVSGAGRVKTMRGLLASRPGSPDKFDASSLDRGNFAEASKSPMLGKLLSAKVMPEGGWRAVQVGSDTLVISFEDADLARDFGRRASTKGYSATSPVATTGRYWNVEVKNG